MNRNSKHFMVLIAILLFASFASTAMATTYYVDATGDNTTGLTLATAKTTIVGGVAIATASGDIVNVSPGTYAEYVNLTALAVDITIRKTPGTTGAVTITGLTGTPAIALGATSDGTVLEGLTVKPFATEATATSIVTVAAGADNITFRDCSFELVALATTVNNGITYLGAVSGVTVENSSFDLTALTTFVAGNSATWHNGIVFSTGLVSNVDIYGCTFTDVVTHTTSSSVLVMDGVVEATIDEFDFTGNTCTYAPLKFLVRNTAAAGGSIGNTRINGNIFQSGSGVLFQTVVPGAQQYTVGIALTGTLTIPATSKQILIKGNHFGSASTDGDAMYAVLFLGLGGDKVREADVHINYNHLQYPQTAGASTGSANGHIGWVGQAAATSTIDAQYNWWGSISGPIGAYASGAIAVIDATDFTGANYLASYGVPGLDELTHGVEYFDFDNNGYIDRAVVWVDFWLDPATISNADFSVTGYTFDSAKAAKLGMDNDGNGASDGPYALTLFLTEGTVMDTGALPNVTFTSPATGGIRGITGNSSAKMLSFTATGASLHDKAYPIVKSVTTGDVNINGRLDRLVVVYSEPMKALTSAQWIVGFAATAGTFNLQYITGTTGYTATSASQVGDTVTYILTEITTGNDTGNTPDFVYTTNNTVMDLALNQIPTFTKVSVDGATPVAISVTTADANADGYIDRFVITFSETITQTGSGTSSGANAEITATTVENSITIGDAGTATAAGAVLTVTGTNNMEKQNVDLHPWDTDATPDVSISGTVSAVKDAASQSWKYFTGGVTTLASTDGALPIITEAFGEVGTTNAYVTFSEPVYTDNAGASITDVSVDLTFTNSGAGATAFATTGAVIDGDASDATITLKTDEVFVTADMGADQVNAIASALQDGTGSVALSTQGNYVTATLVAFTLYDVVPPYLKRINTADFDADGYIDHLVFTFDASINDAVLTSYAGTDLLSPAVDWTVDGYTVVGLNFVSSYAEQTTATADALTNFPNAALDARDRVVWPITSADADNDATLYLMVEEKTVGDTDAKPASTILGATAAVKDLKMNVLADQTAVPSWDYAGPAITSASMVSTTQMDVVFSEPLNPLQTFSQTIAAAPGNKFKGAFSWIVGTDEANYTASILNADMMTDADGGTFYRLTSTSTIPGGTVSKIALAGALAGSGAQDAVVYTEDVYWNDDEDCTKTDLVPNFNTQNMAQTTTVLNADEGDDTTGSGVAGYITVEILPATEPAATAVAKAALTAVSTNLPAINNNNVTRVYFYGTAGAADSIAVKLIDKAGTATTAVLVEADSTTGIFEGQIDASVLANGILNLMAGKKAADETIGWQTFGDYYKESMTIGEPADLEITDIPNDNGGFVDVTFLKSSNDIGNASDWYEVDYYVLQATKGDDFFTVATLPVDGNADSTYRAANVWVGTGITIRTRNFRVNAHAKVVGIGKVAADAPGPMSSAYAYADGSANDERLPGAFTVKADGTGGGVVFTLAAPTDHGLVYADYDIWGVDRYDVYRKIHGSTDSYVKVKTGTPASGVWTLSGKYVIGAITIVDNIGNGTTLYDYQVKACDGPVDDPLTQVASSTEILKVMATKGADFNGNGKVDGGDLQLLGLNWNLKSSDAGYVVNYDLNHDGVISGGDLQILGLAWGTAGKVAKEALPVTSDVAMTMGANYDGTSSIYYVNVAADKIDGINGIGFTMSYDADALELVKDGITGLGEVSITKQAEAGMVDIYSYFMDREFTGTITVAFNSKGMSKDIDFELVDAIVSIDNVISAVNAARISVPAMPTVYSLNQNFPNPFNPTTTIEYSIPQAGHVNLVIYNLAGQKVRTLINENQPASFKKVVWDGRNDMGETVGAGMYFYKLVSGSFSKIQKMTLIK